MRNEIIENATSVYTSYKSLPNNLINAEISGIYGSALLSEMNELIELYKIYESGADFAVDTSKDYTPSDLKIKKSKHLIDKEARFMFSIPLDINIRPKGKTLQNIEKDEIVKNISVIQTFIKNVLNKNNFNNGLLKAAKDCFIGKRIAIIANFNDDGITISFCPSLEFVYDVDIKDFNKMTKIVCFFTLEDSEDKNEQRIYKKKYWLADDGYCHVNEAIYNGKGEEIEVIYEDLTTKFTYIPAVVIVNDGLTGDLNGSSDIGEVYEFESVYSKLDNADVDAERQGMSQIKYAIDVAPESTKNLKIAPGAFWDLTSDINNEKTGKVGTLDNNMSYSDALGNTLKRIETNMYEQLDVPNTNIENIKGLITSGKGLKSLYWPMIVRCNEKMLVWLSKLEFLIRCLIDGALLYPNSYKNYIYGEKLPKMDYDVEIVNNYALPEDEIEEKTMDIQEVNSQAMSRKAYMKKWRNLTEEEADKELKQIALERQLLEDTFYESDSDETNDLTNDLTNKMTNDQANNGNGVTKGISELRDNV